MRSTLGWSVDREGNIRILGHPLRAKLWKIQVKNKMNLDPAYPGLLGKWVAKEIYKPKSTKVRGLEQHDCGSTRQT